MIVDITCRSCGQIVCRGEVNVLDIECRYCGTKQRLYAPHEQYCVNLMNRELKGRNITVSLSQGYVIPSGMEDLNRERILIEGE